MSKINDFETRDTSVRNLETLEIDSNTCLNLSSNLEDDLISFHERDSFSNKRGNLLVFFYIKSGKPLIVIGQNCKNKVKLGKLSTLFSLSIILITFIFEYYLWNHLISIINYSGLIILTVFIASFIMTILSNPGIPFNNKDIDTNKVFHDLKNYKICSICQAILEIKMNSHHCFECGICIDGIII